MKHILLIPNPGKDPGLDVTARVAARLTDTGCHVLLDGRYGTDLGCCEIYTGELPETIDLVVVVGGDGSVLDASVTAIERDVPILGVNLGKVGFLSEVEPDELSLLDRIAAGDYQIAEKMLLSVSCATEGGYAACRRLAVNDVVISHDSYLGIADLAVSSDSCGRIRYRADGIVLSTPAGSTAYSLSAGGPIVSHTVDAILATPVCPHSFFNRSVVFGTEETLTVQNDGTGALNISIDGRCTASLRAGEACQVRMAEKKLRVLTFQPNSMFSMLFRKMKLWEDVKA